MFGDWVRLILENWRYIYFMYKTPCGIRKLMAAFISKRGIFSRFSWSLDFGTKMAEFLLLVPKFDNLLLFNSSWWIFMCQNVNIIVYIRSPNLVMCVIAKIGGCTRLVTWLASATKKWLAECGQVTQQTCPLGLRHFAHNEIHFVLHLTTIWSKLNHWLFK